jgi:hypothetical protein
LVPINRSDAVDLHVVEEKPEEIIERFFAEVVRPSLNRRVRSLAVWSAHAQWCVDRGLEPVSHAMFGRLARWRKDRIGGTVWYLDCELSEGYAELASAGPGALPRQRGSAQDTGQTSMVKTRGQQRGIAQCSGEQYGSEFCGTFA